MSAYSRNAVGQYIEELSAVHTSAFTATANDLNRADVSTSSFVCTLPTAASAGGLIICIQITSHSPLYELTITGDGAETIDGVSDIYVQAQACSEFFSDGSEWHWLKKGQRFIHAGVGSAWTAGLATDNTYNDLDLSSVIPMVARNNGVYFKFYGWGTATRSLILHHPDITDVVNMSYALCGTVGESNCIVPCNSSRIVVYKISGSMNNYQLVINGWFVDV